MKRMFISFVLLFLLVPFLKSQTVYNTVYIPSDDDDTRSQVFGDITIHAAFQLTKIYWMKPKWHLILPR